MDLANQRAFIRKLGLGTWFRMKIWPRVTCLIGGDKLGCVSLPDSEHPLFYRPRSSDVGAFSQIFVEREYAGFDDLVRPGLILDCGANVGYSAAYFLTRFPECSLISIEPDPGNYEVMKRNLAGFGDRARAIRAAIWSRPARLKVVRSSYRDGRDWSTQVAECAAGEDSDVEAVDIATLLRESGHERVSLLKMDIEGAEAEVFSSDIGSWIDRVDNIAIELHDDSCFGKASEVFEKAISGRGFELSTAGELTICRRVR